MFRNHYTSCYGGIVVQRFGPADRMCLLQHSNQVFNHQLQLERAIFDLSLWLYDGLGTDQWCDRQYAHQYVQHHTNVFFIIPRISPQPSRQSAYTHIFQCLGWRRDGIYAAKSAQKPLHNTVAVTVKLSHRRPNRTVVAHQMQALSLICYRYVRTLLSWKSFHGGRTWVGRFSHASQTTTKNIIESGSA